MTQKQLLKIHKLMQDRTDCDRISFEFEMGNVLTWKYSLCFFSKNNEIIKYFLTDNINEIIKELEK